MLLFPSLRHSILFLTMMAASSQGLAQVQLEVFATGFTRPVAIAGAGDNRLFVVEQAGKIFIADSAIQPNGEPFLDITDRVGSAGNEQGLLGLAFHPNYRENGYFFVNYTDTVGNTVVSRFQVSTFSPDFAEPSSEKGILTFPQPYPNHNGGDLRFGPDGFLYISSGDGGSGGDPLDNAQNLATYLGKILRIDVDGGAPYAIPPTNPFSGDTTAVDEIWAYGLRNPWRFSFDRETGDLWSGDVGQQEIEEINFQPSGSSGGENYGWRCYEGSAVYNRLNCPPDSAFTFPVHEYSHDSGHCSVTGGFVYRGSKYTGLAGHYFFADYCSGTLWSLSGSPGRWEVQDHGSFPEENFSAFGEDTEGELYVAGLSSGTVYRITSTVQGGTGTRTHGPLRFRPNPSGSMLSIEGLPPAAGIRVVVAGPAGKILRDATATGPRHHLEVHSLEPGIYVVRVTAGDWSATGTFIRE